MYPSRFIFCLATVMILQQSVVAPPVPVPDLDNFINVNTNVLDKFIQKKIDQAFIGDQSTSGVDYVNSICRRMFANHSRMFANQPCKFVNTRTFTNSY